MANFKSIKTGKFVKNLSDEEKQIYATFLYQRFVFLENSIYEHFLKNKSNFTADHYRVYLRIFYLLKKSYYRAKSFGLEFNWPGEPRLCINFNKSSYSNQRTAKIMLGSFMFLLREINKSHYEKIPAVVAAIKKIKYFHNQKLRDYNRVCHECLKTVKERSIVKDRGNTFVVAGGLYC